MNSNKLMTYAAAAFAGFALWYVTRKPANSATAAQPGQAARNAGLQLFNDAQQAQWNEIIKGSSVYAPPLLEPLPIPVIEIDKDPIRSNNTIFISQDLMR